MQMTDVPERHTPPWSSREGYATGTPIKHKGDPDLERKRTAWEPFRTSSTRVGRMERRHLRASRRQLDSCDPGRIVSEPRIVGS